VLSHPQALLKTNFYCFLTIHRQAQSARCQTLLAQTLADPLCTGGLRALTRYHLCLLHFHTDMSACAIACEELVG
jgi:hypothetical protein